MASFTKEVNLQLTKRPLKTNGRLASLELTSSVEEDTGVYLSDTEQVLSNYWMFSVCVLSGRLSSVRDMIFDNTE